MHALKLYECHEAIRLPVGSVGLYASHCVRSLVQVRPPVMMTLVAPVARTAAVPSQHSSLSGTRTAWMFQVFIALMEAWSAGPSHMPLPWMQANSPLERFTPSIRYVLPAAVTRWLPDTCNAGAGPPVP